jgi:hypothetical protein
MIEQIHQAFVLSSRQLFGWPRMWLGPEGFAPALVEFLFPLRDSTGRHAETPGHVGGAAPSVQQRDCTQSALFKVL